MAQLLWTYDDLLPFLQHPDHPLRLWAVERLIHLFPDRAGDALIPMLGDSHRFIVFEVARFLGQSGERERYGPPLMEHLRQDEGERAGQFAHALAQLDYREAVPLLLERLEQIAQDPNLLRRGRLWALFSALGTFGGEAVRQALWNTFTHFSSDDTDLSYAATALLEAALPEDVVRLVQFYRSREAGRDREQYLDALGFAAGVESLGRELGGFLPHGLEITLDYASWWFEQDPPLSTACLEKLERTLPRGRSDFETMLEEARRIAEGRGDDLSGWQLAWETGLRPLGYPRRTMLTMLILETLAAHPRPYPRLRFYENGLGLALLCQLSLDHDDEAALEAAGDQTEALLEILLSPREHVLPEVVDRVAALGPQIVPRLIDTLEPHDYGWGMIRTAQVIEQLARRYPGSCDDAVPRLVEMIHDEQGDYLLEACAAALEAIGPAAVPQVAERLRDDDLSRQIYLTGVLGEIPTEQSAGAILDWIADGLPTDEMQFSALSDIGTSAAIEPLYRIWLDDPEDTQLAESLLILCQLHAVDKPEMAQWQEVVQDQEDRIAALSGPSPLPTSSELSAEGVAGDEGETPENTDRRAGRHDRRGQTLPRKSQKRKRKKRRRG